MIYSQISPTRSIIRSPPVIRKSPAVADVVLTEPKINNEQENEQSEEKIENKAKDFVEEGKSELVRNYILAIICFNKFISGSLN